MESHSEDLGVFHRGVDLDDMHGGVRSRTLLVPAHERQTSRVLGLALDDGRRHGLRLLPATQGPELGIEGEHVGECGSARAG